MDERKDFSTLARNILTLRTLNDAHRFDHAERGEKEMIRQQIITGLSPIRAWAEMGKLEYTEKDVEDVESAIRDWLKESDHNQQEIDEFMSSSQVKGTLNILKDKATSREKSHN